MRVVEKSILLLIDANFQKSFKFAGPAQKSHKNANYFHGLAFGASFSLR